MLCKRVYKIDCYISLLNNLICSPQGLRNTNTKQVHNQPIINFSLNILLFIIIKILQVTKEFPTHFLNV